jgi:hypothetical protein
MCALSGCDRLLLKCSNIRRPTSEDAAQDMDLAKIINDLTEDKRRIEAAIAMLEDLQRTSVQVPELPKPKRKGRKPMPPEERQVVSDRMKRYWQRYREKRRMVSSA